MDRFLKIKILSFCMCFLSNLNSLPDFMVIGTTKCGTTSLFYYLTKHPQILTSKKELHFFDNDELYKKGGRYYSSLLPSKKSKNVLVGEGSPGYFWREKCITRIAETCPNAKFILILRNPTDRIISHFFHHYNRPMHRQTPYPSFEEGLKNNKIFIKIGCYVNHLQKWHKIFPKKRIHIIILEELIKDPETELNKVFNFLGLPKFKVKTKQILNKGSYKKESIKQESIAWLNDFYAPYNKKLEKYIGRTSPLPWN